MSSSLEVSLSEAELAELDMFLLSDACGEDALSVDEAHGFLTALIVGPRDVPEEQWREAIWGQPDFADEAEAQRMVALLRRLHGDITTALARRAFEPLVAEEEEDGEIFESYEGWCLGFMLGVEHCQEAWTALPKEQQALLAPMAQLALLLNEEEPEMDEEEYESWIELIPGAVAGLHAFWHGAQG